MDKNTHQMKYGGNAKHSEARKIWKIIFMLREVRLEFFWKNKFYFFGGGNNHKLYTEASKSGSEGRIFSTHPVFFQLSYCFSIIFIKFDKIS